MLSDLFSDYVNKCWQGRKDNPAPSVKNLVFKLMMNSLTGKFGQRSTNTQSHLFSCKSEPHLSFKHKSNATYEQISKMMDKVTDFTALYNKNGVNTAIILETVSDDLDPTYPIYLSAQILAYSRIHMSKILRTAGGYFNSDKAFYYTDTDSLVIPHIVLDDLRAANLIGKNLGQMSCDLGEFKNGQFAPIVKAIFAAPKGPYAIVYVDTGEECGNEVKRLLEKTRIKGIPHTNEPFPHIDEQWEDIFSTEGDQLQRVMNWFNNKDGLPIPSDLIGKRLYCYEHLHGEEEGPFYTLARHINYDIIKDVMDYKGLLCCYFGTMEKNIKKVSDDMLTVKPTVLRRYLNSRDWWNSNNRIYLDGATSDLDLSYPVGYTE